MTVAALIKLLSKEDPKRIVVLSADSEGNSYSPLSGAGTAAYVADSTWSGSIGLEKLTPALKKQGYTDEDVLDGKPALVLYPTN